MSGQSIVDRLTAAKHSIAGSGLAKSVCKATTEEVMGPKKKHLDYLLQCTNEPNVSIPQLANLLIERTQNQSWTVVFKSLVTIHNLMNYGNERFTQFLASNNCSFQLGNFIDKQGAQGYDMSTFIRRYAKYLNEKAVSYRSMAFDFCKVKRGKDDGLLRTMNAEKLLKALPVLQVQLDALLEFDCAPNDLTNGVINAGFMLLFKDLIRLFACYNDGIINLLEKYFDMNKKQCKEGLDIYKKFIIRMDNVGKFLKTAENVGIDKGDIPDLAKAPSSLLDALEQHLQSLEGKKGVTSATNAKSAGVKTAIESFATASQTAANQISEDERRKVLEDENKQLEQLKEQQLQAASPTGSTDLFGASPVSTPAAPAAAAAAAAPQTAASDDLFLLSTPAAPNPFQASQPAPAQPQPAADAFGAQSTNPFGSPVAPAAAPAASNPWGASPAFGGGSMVTLTAQPPPGFDGFGEVLKPESSQPVAANQEPAKKLVGSDLGLDMSLASLAGNLNINGPAHQVKKVDHQWKPTGDKKKTGGSTFNQPVMSSGPTIPPMSSQPFQTSMMGNSMMQPMAMNQGYGGGYQNGWGGQSMAAQPMGGFPQTGMGMGPRPGMQTGGMYGQPMMGQPRPSQPNDPFGAL